MANTESLGGLIAKTDKRTIAKYIQFSKKIVTSIIFAATLICAWGMLICK